MAKMPKDSTQSPGAQDKESVNYRMGDPQGERCETCSEFRPEEELCSRVQGQISPRGMCDMYSGMGEGEEKAETQADPAMLEQMLFGGGMGGGGLR